MRCRFLLPLILSVWPLAHAFAHTIERWKTDNGVPVVFYQAMEVPMIDISMAFAAGSAYDQSQFGLASLTTQLLNEGNGGESATAIADDLAAQGSQYRSETLRDMAVYSLRSLTAPESLEVSVDRFTRIISAPDFPEDAFKHEKNQILAAIEQEKETPDNVAMETFFNLLYKNHPYAHPVNGTQQSVANIRRNDVVSFYKTYYNRNNALIVMVGALPKERAKQIANQISKPLQDGVKAPAIAKAPDLKHQETQHVAFPSAQTVIRMGQPGIDHQNPDYFPLMVGNYILGGGSLVSLLAHEVREKEGLSYGVSSQLVSMPGRGPFIIGLSTRNKQTQQALAITQQTLSDFIKNGPTEEQLKAAKAYMTGSYPLSLTSNRDIASLLLRMSFYHLPDNYLDTYIQNVNKVTTSEVKQAFQKYIHPDRMVLVTVGPK